MDFSNPKNPDPPVQTPKTGGSNRYPMTSQGFLEKTSFLENMVMSRLGHVLHVPHVPEIATMSFGSFGAGDLKYRVKSGGVQSFRSVTIK